MWTKPPLYYTNVIDHKMDVSSSQKMYLSVAASDLSRPSLQRDPTRQSSYQAPHSSRHRLPFSCHNRILIAIQPVICLHFSMSVRKKRRPAIYRQTATQRFTCHPEDGKIPSHTEILKHCCHLCYIVSTNCKWKSSFLMKRGDGKECLAFCIHTTQSVIRYILLPYMVYILGLIDGLLEDDQNCSL